MIPPYPWDLVVAGFWIGLGAAVGWLLVSFVVSGLRSLVSWLLDWRIRVRFGWNG